MPTLAVVSGSSVRSGLISLTAPTSVVLPTPKPPAIRILAAAGRFRRAVSECLESIEHLPQQSLDRLPAASAWSRDPDQSLADEVAEQDADHPEREVDFGGQVDDRRGPAAQAQDPPVLGPGPEMLPASGSLVATHHVDQVERRPAARQRPPLGQGVGPDDRPGVPVEPAVP